MPTTQKIRYSDCDPQGIVFNGNYARYWDDAVTDWLEEAFGASGLADTGADMVAAHLEIDFKAAATLGDTLETSVAVERLGNTSMTIALVTRRLSDGEVVVSGHEVVVFVDPADFRPVPIPEAVRRALHEESTLSG